MTTEAVGRWDLKWLLRRPATRGTGPKKVIALTGHAGAGKSDLALSLKTVLGEETIEVVSFRAAVEDRIRSARTETASLAVVGQEWVDTDPDGFIEAVLGQSGAESSVVVVDGVHHLDIQRRLEKIFEPSPVLLVMLKDDRHLTAVADDGGAADSLLSSPVEVEVGRELLAEADLVLDAGEEALRNAQVVAEILSSIGVGSANLKREGYVGGLSARQRAWVLESIATTHSWLLPREVARLLSEPISEVIKRTSLNTLLGVDVKGTVLYPSFIIGDNHATDADVQRVLKMLSPVMTKWEILAWFISPNGLLDGVRPVDALTQAPAAAESELDA